MTDTHTPGHKRGTVFLWTRFSTLIRVDLAERWRIYAGLLLIALVIQILLLSWVCLLESSPAPLNSVGQQAWYNAFLFIFGIAFCFAFHAPMHRQGSSLLILMRPTSTLEKWLHAAIMLTVLFPLAYTLCYLVATVPISAIAAVLENARYERLIATEPRANPGKPIGFQVFIPLLSAGYEKGVSQWKQMLFFWWYAVVCGYAAFALVMFRRAAVFKSVALAFIVLILCVMTLSVSAGFSGKAVTLTSWQSANGLSVLSASDVIANLLLWLGVPMLVWCSAWLALRERDLT